MLGVAYFFFGGICAYGGGSRWHSNQHLVLTAAVIAAMCTLVDCAFRSLAARAALAFIFTSSASPLVAFLTFASFAALAARAATGRTASTPDGARAALALEVVLSNGNRPDVCNNALLSAQGGPGVPHSTLG